MTPRLEAAGAQQPGRDIAQILMRMLFGSDYRLLIPTSALGGAPRVGRTNFPLDFGYLPARIVVKLAPFSEASLQHFVYLERPMGSNEPEGVGFEPERMFQRSVSAERLTPMPIDYSTVGEFYEVLGEGLRALVARVGEAAAFAGDPALQLSSTETALPWARNMVRARP